LRSSKASINFFELWNNLRKIAYFCLFWLWRDNVQYRIRNLCTAVFFWVNWTPQHKIGPNRYWNEDKDVIGGLRKMPKELRNSSSNTIRFNKSVTMTSEGHERRKTP